MKWGVVALVALGVGCAQIVDRPDIVIGTASPVDVVYPLGGSICRLFNLNTPQHGLRCGEEPSAGPIANIESLLKGHIDVGIVPSDVLGEIMGGHRPLATAGRVSDLRVLFAGHADVFTLIARQGSGISAVADLRLKRIGIGIPGSRHRFNMKHVLSAFGLTLNDFTEVRELPPGEQNRAFCARELDAIAYSVAHPSGLIRHATLTCGGMLISVTGPGIDKMLVDRNEYELAVIPGWTYPGGSGDVYTVGVRAVVVTTNRMSDAVAYQVTRALFDNFDDFRRLHPAFEALSVSEMIRSNALAPAHPGAARYYREHGWLP